MFYINGLKLKKTLNIYDKKTNNNVDLVFIISNTYKLKINDIKHICFFIRQYDNRVDIRHIYIYTIYPFCMFSANVYTVYSILCNLCYHNYYNL